MAEAVRRRPAQADGRVVLGSVERDDGTLAWLLEDADGTLYFGGTEGAVPIDDSQVERDDAVPQRHLFGYGRRGVYRLREGDLRLCPWQLLVQHLPALLDDVYRGFDRLRHAPRRRLRIGLLRYPAPDRLRRGTPVAEDRGEVLGVRH